MILGSTDRSALCSLYWCRDDSCYPILASQSCLPNVIVLFQILQHWTWSLFLHLDDLHCSFKIKFQILYLVMTSPAVLCLQWPSVWLGTDGWSDPPQSNLPIVFFLRFLHPFDFTIKCFLPSGLISYFVREFVIKNCFWQDWVSMNFNCKNWIRSKRLCIKNQSKLTEWYHLNMCFEAIKLLCNFEWKESTLLWKWGH